jgi:simple sugar transport system ATP-binding protein
MRDVAVDVLRTTVHISGIDDPDKEVGELSGGQKQAVAIARAVHFKRRILLLDEPSSALSVRETENLLAYIKRLRDENVSSVLVTHNLYHAYQVCDRFVVMSHGREVVDVAKAATSIDELTRYVVLT